MTANRGIQFDSPSRQANVVLAIDPAWSRCLTCSSEKGPSFSPFSFRNISITSAGNYIVPSVSVNQNHHAYVTDFLGVFLGAKKIRCPACEIPQKTKGIDVVC